MYPRIRLIVAAAVVLVLFRAAVNPGEATVIHDGKTRHLNPTVEAGGHPLPAKGADNQPRVVFPYSLIGALRSEANWFPPCIVSPWNGFNSFDRNRHDSAGRLTGTRSKNGLINRPPRPAP